ncbi:hypothetical protein [Streptomyces griseorubiginosus]
MLSWGIARAGLGVGGVRAGHDDRRAGLVVLLVLLLEVLAGGAFGKVLLGHPEGVADAVTQVHEDQLAHDLAKVLR